MGGGGILLNYVCTPYTSMYVCTLGDGILFNYVSIAS